MALVQDSLDVRTPGRGTIDITARIDASIASSGVRLGLCVVFLQHTSASLVICENADPAVRFDLEAWLVRAVPDGDRIFTHTAEGPDDMPAHVRSVLTQTSLTLPVEDGRLALGTWQGIYLYEHRVRPHVRRISVSVLA